MTEREFDQCVKRIQKGDREGLRAVYEAYLPYIFPIVLNIVGNREDAEDITSEFFIRFWNTAEKYRPGTGHKAYLAAIARNMSIDFCRRRKREIPAALSGGSEEEENAAYQENAERPQPDDRYEGFEDKLVDSLTLKEALKTLSGTEREILHLKFAGDLTFKEISSVLKVPMGTVTWRYREAISKLRRYGFDERS